jgi:hypothetical protein
VAEQLKSYPSSSAQHSETAFIHRDLHHHELPSPIRVAFGICAAHLCVNKGNKAMLFRTLDAKMSTLFQPTQDDSLLQALSKMQAMLLCQIIRIYHGDDKQRNLAE